MSAFATSVPNDNAQLGPSYECPPSEEQTVKLWRKRVKDAKTYFDNDFKRMRENMEFAANIQWLGQDSTDDKEDRYIANFITHHVNQKVASLYARDPQSKAKRRKRLDFQIWDGEEVSLMQAQLVAQQSAMMGMQSPQSLQAMALLADVQQGKQWQQLCERVGKTLEILYGYQCDTQAPSFKFQMKQLVRRVITCGVGYVRLNYVTTGDHILSSSLTDDSLAYRLKRAKAILAGVEDDEIQEDDPRIEQLKLLMNSVVSSVQQGDMTNVEQRLEFDFPSATSIIVDPRCKCLKGFIGADWVAQQYILPLNSANAYFELRGNKVITTGGEFVQYADDATPMPKPTTENAPKDLEKSPLGCFWEVFDLTTKTHFFICDGWKEYVQYPQPINPSINRFWPIFSLTFNDIELDPGQKVHIYPPSDVQLLKSMQKEVNRSRQELREHRKINRPFFWTMQNTITEGDLEKFQQHESGELITLQQPLMGANGQQNVVDAIGKWTGVPIDANLYNTAPQESDITAVVGSNQIQQQRPIRHVAATPAVIQEQARMSDVNSNVDDLDDLLSELAQGAGEMMLREFRPDTVQRIVGRGAVWPQDQKEDFLNEIYLDIVAASSGRPNKAVDISNAQSIVPLMLQAGANPWAIIQYVCKVLDANIDPTDFAPVPQIQQPQGQPQQQQQRQGPPHPQHPQHPGLQGQQQGGAGVMPGVQLGGPH